MVIVHCVEKAVWEARENRAYYGEDLVRREGFIHCSDVHTFHRVAPNFRSVAAPLVLLCMDTEQLEPEVRWEDLDGCGTEYPHLYGPLNTGAVVRVLPFLRDENGDFVLNPELQSEG